MANAQERALANRLLRRGLLTPGSLARLQASRGPGEPFISSLVKAGVAQPESLQALLVELSACRWDCAACQRGLSWKDLAALEHPACPTCGRTLAQTDPHEETARSDSAPPARRRTSSVGSTGPGGVEFNGQTIGPYELMHELGRGSNGIVFLGRRAGIQRYLAVKILRDADQADEETVARFQLEAAVASKLTHPGIAAVHDVGWDGGHLYYAMDYVKGPTLKERLREGPLDNTEAAVLIGRLARTLAFAHEAGVIHRDVKPANIILAEENGKPRIMDFGLAQDRSLLRSMTQTGDVIGTPYYMSPEQFRGLKDIDHRVDIYALGAILYEALSGQRPYTATSALELAGMVTRGDPTPPTEIREGVSPGLEAICLRSMSPDREDRFPTATALRDEVERVLRDELRADAPGASGPRRGPRPATALAAIGVLAVGVGTAIALVLSAQGDPRAESPISHPELGAGGDPATLISQARALLRTRVVEEAQAPYPEVRVLLEQAVRGLEGREGHGLAVLELASYSIRRGQTERALSLLDALPPGTDQAGRALILRGRAEEDRGRTDPAREAWEAARRADPDGLWGAIAEAALRRDAGEVDAAAAAAERARQLSADSPHALLELGRARLNGDPKQRDQALVALERLGQLAPDDPNLALALAELRMNEEKSGSARRAIQRAFTLTNPYPYLPALLIRARFRLSNGELELAQEDCEQALSIAPEDVEGLSLRGLVRLELGDEEGARADLERAGLSDKAHQARVLAKAPSSLVKRARALFEPQPGPSPRSSPRPSPSATRTNPLVSLFGRPQGPTIPWGTLTEPLRANLAARVAEIEPQAARKSLLEALELGAQGKPWDRVADALERAGQLAPDSREMCLEQIRVCVGRGRIEEALERFTYAAKHGWRGPLFELCRADAAWWQGDLGRAAMGLRSLASGEGLPAALATAMLALLSGDDAAADEAAQRALAQRPSHGPALLIRGLAMSGGGGLGLQTTIYDLQGLLDLRLATLYRISTEPSFLSTFQSPQGTSNSLLEDLLKESPHPDLLAADLVIRSSIVTRSLSGFLSALAGNEQAYYHVVSARYRTQALDANRTLRSWRRVLEISPGFGVPAPDRIMLRRKFPGDKRFTRLWGE